MLGALVILAMQVVKPCAGANFGDHATGWLRSIIFEWLHTFKSPAAGLGGCIGYCHYKSTLERC